MIEDGERFLKIGALIHADFSVFENHPDGVWLVRDFLDVVDVEVQHASMLTRGVAWKR